jgi:PAS domain S-box-containing protein
VLDAIPGGVYLCDDNGYLVAYNRVAAELWGRTPAIQEERLQFCGSHRLLKDGEALHHHESPMAKAIRDGLAVQNEEVLVEWPDGTRICVLINVRPLRDHFGELEGAIASLQDISAQKQLEDDLRKKTEDLEDFFENGAIGLHIVSSDGIIRRANQAELTLLGYEEHEYVGKHIASFHVDAPVIQDILKRLGRGESLEQYPARLRASDGSIKHVLITSSGRFRGGQFFSSRCFTTDVTAVREAEEAREASERRLAATYQSAIIGIAEAGSDGRLLRVNSAFCQMLGRTADELLKMTFLDYSHPDDREADFTSYAKQVSGEIDSYALRKQAIKGDGSSVFLDVYSSSVRGTDGRFLYGVRILVDVTEAKLANDRLLENEKRLRDLLEALPAAVYTTDADGRITFFNKAAVEMTGRVPELGDLWCVSWRLYRPDGTFLPHDECPMAVALKERRAVRGEEAIVERPDGTRIPFIPYPTPLYDHDGKMIGAINMLVDITDRKNAEQYAERLAAIVEFSDDAIVSKDTTGTIQTWNKGAERLFGYSAEQVIGKPINILIPPDRQDEEPEILSRILKSEAIDHYETIRMKSDGGLIDVSLTVSPLKNVKGEVIGASKIARDITAHRQEARHRQLLINELNHRVKNTLATVQSLAAQTFRGERDVASFKRFETRLIALARAHDLLTRESWEGADIQDVFDRSIRVVCPEPKDRFFISGPSFRLRPKVALSLSMAFHELATNAAKYGALLGEQGKIRVQWEVTSGEERHLRLEWAEAGGPDVRRPERKGFGSRLLEQALARELGAIAELSFNVSGIIFRLDVPIR